MDIQLSALVCSKDQRTIKVLQVLLGEMSIGMELCATRDEAARHLVSRRFDGVFVDAGVESSGELLLDITQAPGGQRAVPFAILEGATSVKEAFSLGAGFILYKPLSIEKTKNSLRAAHGLMMRERRRHFRHTLEDVIATLRFAGAPETNAEILDLSEGGMALRLLEYMERRGDLRASFRLPGHDQALEVEGEITWADDHGRIGVHFTAVPQPVRAALESWLSERGRTAAEDAQGAIKAHSRKRNVQGGRVAAVSAITGAAPAAAPEVKAPTVPRARHALRAGTDVGVSVVTIRGGEPVVLQAVCDDISPEGLGAVVQDELCPGEPVL
ncbi:MAG TPA: PilZ domain-containing protein, partial [Terriglobales bacterium]|nr:PilZ domain-containing protein [Terriglobales bacterium]